MFLLAVNEDLKSDSPEIPDSDGPNFNKVFLLRGISAEVGDVNSLEDLLSPEAMLSLDLATAALDRGTTLPSLIFEV